MPKEKSEKKTRNAGGRPLTDTERRAHVGQVIRKYRTAAGMDQAAPMPSSCRPIGLIPLRFAVTSLIL